jgi:hypothetical protein
LNNVVLKGMSATVINVFMPCLLFSKTVPSFTADNLPEVGVLVLTAVFYQSTLSTLSMELTISNGIAVCSYRKMRNPVTRLAEWRDIRRNVFKLGYP